MSKFIDEVVVRVEAGSGGNGCLSFRRERCLPKGGPDGGDGGNGGSIFFQACENTTTLSHLRFKHIIKAKNGHAGAGQNKTGLKGEDCIIKVPLGTQIFDHNSNQLLIDLTKHDQIACLAKGGDHGLGNTRFKTSTDRAPRTISNGHPGESRQLRLELSVMADIGLIGLPNAGKSSLIRAISQAKPKVANYPFTTTRPHLGVCHVDAATEFVIADIPGLIAGASQGHGLGDQFLRHLSRCKTLLHIVSVYEEFDYDPLEAIATINQEMQDTLANKVAFIILTKTDLIDPETQLELETKIAKKYPKLQVLAISSIAKIGLEKLKFLVAKKLDSTINLG